MNTRVPWIEELKFSKAHNIWATASEFDHLHRLLTQQKIPPPKTVITEPVKDVASPTATYGVKSGTPPKQYSEDSHQTRYRAQVADLLKKYPNVGFYESLNKWNGNYTVKQAAAIERAHKDAFGGYGPTPIETNITEEEMNDPNWTPWD